MCYPSTSYHIYNLHGTMVQSNHTQVHDVIQRENNQSAEYSVATGEEMLIKNVQGSQGGGLGDLFGN